MRKLLSGNEALAQGAWEAGVRTAFGYPGTPSTEILENLVKMPDVYCEWSPNEKVALESAAGAAIAGARSIVTMKHVGLNVAADPMMTLSYIGIRAGLVIVVADDPGQHSSQTEQDTRHYARLAKLPVLEPGNAPECLRFMKRALDISEKYRCPVILRSTTCVSHSRFLTETGERVVPEFAPFERNPQQFVPIPVWGRKLRVRIEDRMAEQSAESSADPELNTVFERPDAPFGIISSGVTALHCLDVFPEASILKIGWSWPFPDALLKKFAAAHRRIFVVEEADPILEEHVKSLGIAADGKNFVPRTGELVPERLAAVRSAYLGLPLPEKKTCPETADLPTRPPMLCAGCPHRGIFYGLSKFDVIVAGDIGCYSLGVFPPLSRTDVLLCMGGGFTMAHGLNKGGEKRPVVGIVGDSTFFHSGITGLLNLVYNKGNATLIVVDNRTTAMTGHQDHPGTGRTLMGEATQCASIEAIARACGMKRVVTVDPNDLGEVHRVLTQELAADEPSLIISRAPCILKEPPKDRKAVRIDGTCKNCKACLKLGCPAIENPDKDAKPQVNAGMCVGCGQCLSVCRFGAIRIS